MGQKKQIPGNIVSSFVSPVRGNQQSIIMDKYSQVTYGQHERVKNTSWQPWNGPLWTINHRHLSKTTTLNPSTNQKNKNPPPFPRMVKFHKSQKGIYAGIRCLQVSIWFWMAHGEPTSGPGPQSTYLHILISLRSEVLYTTLKRVTRKAGLEPHHKKCNKGTWGVYYVIIHHLNYLARRS